MEEGGKKSAKNTLFYWLARDEMTMAGAARHRQNSRHTFSLRAGLWCWGWTGMRTTAVPSAQHAATMEIAAGASLRLDCGPLEGLKQETRRCSNGARLGLGTTKRLKH